MKKIPSKLNLIEFNPLSNKEFKAASQESIDKFSKNSRSRFSSYLEEVEEEILMLHVAR